MALRKPEFQRQAPTCTEYAKLGLWLIPLHTNNHTSCQGLKAIHK